MVTVLLMHGPGYLKIKALSLQSESELDQTFQLETSYQQGGFADCFSGVSSLCRNNFLSKKKKASVLLTLMQSVSVSTFGITSVSVSHCQLIV